VHVAIDKAVALFHPVLTPFANATATVAGCRLGKILPMATRGAISPVAKERREWLSRVQAVWKRPEISVLAIPPWANLL
jgi:hypothetical protein